MIFYCIVFSEIQEKFLESRHSGIDRYRLVFCLARAAVTAPAERDVKGYRIRLRMGQAAVSEVELASTFGCSRKTIVRLVGEMRRIGLVTAESTNRATVFTLLYLSGWLIDGIMLRNPYYRRPTGKEETTSGATVTSARKRLPHADTRADAAARKGKGITSPSLISEHVVTEAYASAMSCCDTAEGRHGDSRDGNATDDAQSCPSGQADATSLRDRTDDAHEDKDIRGKRPVAPGFDEGSPAADGCGG